MKITVERFVRDADTTIGLVSVDGAFRCFALEDTYRPVKVAGETRIPAGVYPVKLRRDGGVHEKYAKAYPDFHRGMLWLQDVSGFEWIYIHVGNTHLHTEGCILVGEGAICPHPGRKSIQASASAYRKLYEAVIDVAEAGALTIEVVDRDRDSF